MAITNRKKGVKKQTFGAYKKSLGLGTITEKDVTANYIEQTQIARNKFNSKYFGLGDKGKQATLKEEEIAKQITQGFIDNYLSQGLNNLTTNFGNADHKKGSTYSSIQEKLEEIAMGTKEGKNVDQLINDLDRMLNLAIKYLKLDMPAEMSSMLFSDNNSGATMSSLKKRNVSSMKLIGNSNKAAITSYHSLMEAYKHDILEFARKGTELRLGSKGYTMEGLGVEDKFVKIYNDKGKCIGTKPVKGSEIANTIGGFFAQITGQIFETLLKDTLKSGLGSLAKAVINDGDKTDDSGKKQKADLEVEYNGKIFNIEMAKLIKDANAGEKFNVQFNRNIDTGTFSAKKKARGESNSFLNSSSDKLFEYYAQAGGIESYAQLMKHGIQLGMAYDGRGMKYLNRYVASKASNMVLGDSIDFLVFLDEVVPKYEFLNSMAKGKESRLRFVYAAKKGKDNIAGSVKN